MKTLDTEMNYMVWRK